MEHTYHNCPHITYQRYPQRAHMQAQALGGSTNADSPTTHSTRGTNPDGS